MVGSIVVFSSTIPLDKMERIVRSRVERDGQAAVAGKGQRQDRRLHQLHDRLADDAALDVHGWLGQADGVTYLTVTRLGQGASWWGAPTIGDGQGGVEV